MNYEELAKQAILDDMLSCNQCADIGGYEPLALSGIDKIEYYKKNLPGVVYVRDQAVNFIFSNGLTTGEYESNESLQNWLFKKNLNGETNYSVLENAVGNALWDGACGIREYEGNIYCVKRGHYAVLTNITDGIEFVVGYLIRQDGKSIKERIRLKKDYQTISEIYERFAENKLILLDDSNFTNLRNSTDELFGDSPALRDEQRLQLLLSEYRHLNYDLDFDGPGRIVLHADDEITTDEDASSTQLVNQSGGAQKLRNDKALREAKRVAREIKSSSSDAVITLSNAFKEKITHLPRVTKSTDDFFREWIRNEGVILAQDIGISPSLVELGDISGNVSMEKIIDNAIENTIIPLREKFSAQFSDMISRIVGIRKVYFDKYKLSQVEDINNVRQKVTTMIRDVANANKNSPSPDKEELSRMLVEYLEKSLEDSEGNIAELKDSR